MFAGGSWWLREERPSSSAFIAAVSRQEAPALVFVSYRRRAMRCMDGEIFIIAGARELRHRCKQPRHWSSIAPCVRLGAAWMVKF